MPAKFPKIKTPLRPGKPKRARYGDITARNKWPRVKLDYEQLEKAKILIDIITLTSIPDKGYIKEVRVSIMPWSKSGYLDIRTYIKGKPTGRGILIHIDHISQFLSSVISAEREIVKLREQGIFRDDSSVQEMP
jgi:hypothetical protein